MNIYNYNKYNNIFLIFKILNIFKIKYNIIIMIFALLTYNNNITNK